MKWILCLLLVIFFHLNIYTQNTVGLLSYDENRSFEGYNLIFPHNQPNVYLLNNCGEIVHTWQDAPNFRPGNSAYLTEEGFLYKAKRDAIVTGDPIWAGGGGAILEIRDWDNNLIWDFEMNDSLRRLHHDFAVTPKGTILAIAWEVKNLEESIAAGIDASILSRDEVWPDWVFEIDPTTDNIIWEWHAWDHLIQDFDETKSNFGNVAGNPHRMDINYYREDGHPDWMHANAIDYNSELDQIMLSVPYFNEIWIIDHATTTQQATQSFGGFANRGGDLLFRWGNPAAHSNGGITDQKLFFQHDAHWIDDFLEQAHPQFGKIGVFNNRVGIDFSTANIINPAWNMYEWEYTKESEVFLPEEFDQIITHPDTAALFSSGLSSFQTLPNGNSLITAGRFGYSFELTPDNSIVWEYRTPFRGQAPATQGDNLGLNDNLTFRLTRYPIDFPAFVDKDLSPKGWIELEPDSTFCALLTSIEVVMDDSKFKAFPNPTSSMLTIEWDGMKYADIAIFDLTGQIRTRFTSNGGRKYLDVSNWESGLYFISLSVGEGIYTRKILIQQ